MAALPRTFDHVPQDLWERAIISRIQGREAGSGKRHEWAICWRTRQSWTRNNIQPLSRCQGKFAKSARLDSQNAKFWAKTARMHAQSARHAQERHHQALRRRLATRIDYLWAQIDVKFVIGILEEERSCAARPAFA